MLQHIDQTLFFFINNTLANPVLDVVCPFFRNQKNWYMLYAVFAYLLYKKYNTKAIYILLAAGLLIFISDQASANLIKNMFQRLRPCNDDLIKYQVRLLVNCGQGYSFISAHATNHFALAVFVGSLLGHLRWLKPVLLIWASMIAFSQVYVGVHYPADVVFGALLGFILANIMLLAVKKYILKTHHSESV
jgi:undecaprenyl-diphosphatase